MGIIPISKSAQAAVTCCLLLPAETGAAVARLVSFSKCRHLFVSSLCVLTSSVRVCMCSEHSWVTCQVSDDNCSLSIVDNQTKSRNVSLVILFKNAYTVE